MKALIVILLMSGFLTAQATYAQRVEAEPAQVQGPLPDRDNEAGNAECEDGTCNTQHNSDDLTENAYADNLRAKGTLLTGKKSTNGSGSEVTQ